MTKTLEIDPKRYESLGDEVTGIYVRAKDSNGKFQNADIAVLTRESMHHWLRSRGGENLWAENTVAALLGYDAFEG